MYHKNITEELVAFDMIHDTGKRRGRSKKLFKDEAGIIDTRKYVGNRIR